MFTIRAVEKGFNFIPPSWKSKLNTFQKVAAWATFFFIGWILMKGVQRCYKKLNAKGNLDFLGKKTLLKEQIPQMLAAFDNPYIKGQINGIYITTNETHLFATHQRLREHPRPHPEKQIIHVGCATWHNFDIMCLRKSNYGLIIDFNPENAKFIEKTIQLINISESREIFKENMINHLNSLEKELRDLFFHKDQRGLPTDRIKAELLREGSWLQTEENYLFIKTLVSKGNLIAITEDITNFKTFSRIRAFLDKNEIIIDTLYLSNICNFMNTANKKYLFIKSIKEMLGNDTLFISCPKLRQFNSGEVTILQQRTILGREILASSYDTPSLFEEMI